MVYIKKMVMQGFKSFARRTEVLFDKGINVILGPNGSGKSNVSDALCFVLGRLSVKSMRAAKSKNLLFMGSKYVKPAREASVEIIFDNSDRAFSLDAEEVTLKRIIRHNGQGVYKINNETKTRLEVVEMLAQAGIDPYGFNLILQGQIQSIVKMHPEERRKIIEEVAGISIYESRKEKSLKELEKTEEKLKEISAILRERSAYLKNLDRERSQALRFKELESTVKKCKASLIQRKLGDKAKELESVDKSIDEKTKQKDKIKAEAEEIQKEIEAFGNSINQITKSIQQATGIEQETLHSQIANLKAEIEGMRVRSESYEHRRDELLRRIAEMQKSVPELENEIKGLKDESPLMAQKAQELKKKKEELAKIEEEKKRVLTLKTELNSIRERLKDKDRQLSRVNATSDALLKQMEEYARLLTYAGEKECAEAIINLRQSLASHKKQMEEANKTEIEHEKRISVAESESERADKIRKDVEKIDVCPLCRSKITPEHISHVAEDSNKKISESEGIISHAREELRKLKERKEKLFAEAKQTEEKLSAAEIELVKHKSMKDKQEQLKKLVEEEKTIKEEIKALDEKRKSLEEKSTDSSKIEERYDAVMLEIEEISSRTSEDVDTTLLYKERELENTRNIVKRSMKDREEIETQINDIKETLKMKQQTLEGKEKQEREMQARFKKMFEERERIQREMQEKNLKLSETQNMSRGIEDQVNYLRIGKAKLDAEKEALQMEMVEFEGVEIIQGSINALEERLKKSQEALMQIGSINMRALEVYEQVKQEYDVVEQKVNTLEKEKQDILNIIAEIDQKKKRSFMKTYKAMNALFSENFSKLSSKGVAFLELENQEDIFAGGVNIVVKLAKGKYFDVTSLSGGEQTLVALSLLFAIQEYKPYHFYVFDEIDAALDKRNSERLAGLLTQYMKVGQYIVITHNDAIIMNSNVLYGVSMHDGVSKVLSLNVNGKNAETPVQTESSNDEGSEISEEEMPMDEDFAEPAPEEKYEKREMPDDSEEE